MTHQEMPVQHRPSRSLRLPLVCIVAAFASWMSPALAPASVIVESMTQTYEVRFLDPNPTGFQMVRVFGWQSISTALLVSGETGTVPLSMDIGYASALGAPDAPSGRVQFSIEGDPGIRGASTGTVGYFDVAMDVSFLIDQPMQLRLNGSARTVRSENAPTSLFWLSMQSSTVQFDWTPDEFGTREFLDTTFELAPGRHGLSFRSNTWFSNDNTPRHPLSIDADISFAIIPAPATSAILVAGLATASRRRRSR